jgi:hypothetical protein
MLVAAGIDQLRSNACPGALAFHRSLDKQVNLEFASNLGDRLFGILILHAGVTGYDSQGFRLSEVGDELISNTSGEVVLRGIARGWLW